MFYITTINVSVNDQVMTFTNMPIVASGGINENKISFSFSSEWSNLSKIALFYRDKGEYYYAVIGSDNSAVVPSAMTEENGIIHFGVAGSDGSTLQKTTTVLSYEIEEGSFCAFNETTGNLLTLINEKENKSNKVTSLSANSTNEQYPCAKLVYDLLAQKEDIINSGNKLNPEFINVNSTHRFVTDENIAAWNGNNGLDDDITALQTSMNTLSAKVDGYEDDIERSSDCADEFDEMFDETLVKNKDLDELVDADDKIFFVRHFCVGLCTHTPYGSDYPSKASADSTVALLSEAAANKGFPYFISFKSPVSGVVQFVISTNSNDIYIRHLDETDSTYTAWVKLCENPSNKVTSINSASTDEQYPSAKCVYDLVGNVETLLEALL